MNSNKEQPNKFEADEAMLAKFRAEVTEMVHQEDMRRQGHESTNKTAHLYVIEKDGSVRFDVPENLALGDAKMWERVARYKHFADTLSPKRIQIPKDERITRVELKAYAEEVLESKDFSRGHFLGKINNTLSGIQDFVESDE